MNSSQTIRSMSAPSWKTLRSPLLRSAWALLLILALLLGALPAQSAAAAEPSTTRADAVAPVLFLPAIAQDPPTLCRFGVNKDIKGVNIAPLRTGWYLNYGATTRVDSVPRGVTFMLTVRLTQPDPLTNDFEYSIWSDWRPTTEQELLDVIRDNPGAEIFIGNEPDRRDRKVGGQDAIEPQVYAIAYEHLYHLIKGEDPTATIIAGSIVQPTEIRLDYLDIVLAEYKKRFGASMPVDAWATHNFILNEVRGGWGADIPPGIDAISGLVIEDVDETISLDLFTEQIQRFRLWLANNGYRDTPLYVSEYGVLFPA